MCTCRGQKCILLLVPFFSERHTAKGGCILLKHLVLLRETEYGLAQIHVKELLKRKPTPHTDSCLVNLSRFRQFDIGS